jgi:hypothetical protein
VALTAYVLAAAREYIALSIGMASKLAVGLWLETGIVAIDSGTMILVSRDVLLNCGLAVCTHERRGRAAGLPPAIGDIGCGH